MPTQMAREFADWRPHSSLVTNEWMSLGIAILVIRPSLKIVSSGRKLKELASPRVLRVIGPLANKNFCSFI